jgi:hypothetical protein
LRRKQWKIGVVDLDAGRICTRRHVVPERGDAASCSHTDPHNGDSDSNNA